MRLGSDKLTISKLDNIELREITYSVGVGNNDMQVYNKKVLTKWFICREST
jgi:hypothetical protein